MFDFNSSARLCGCKNHAIATTDCSFSNLSLSLSRAHRNSIKQVGASSLALHTCNYFFFSLSSLLLLLFKLDFLTALQNTWREYSCKLFARQASGAKTSERSHDKRSGQLVAYKLAPPAHSIHTLLDQRRLINATVRQSLTITCSGAPTKTTATMRQRAQKIGRTTIEGRQTHTRALPTYCRSSPFSGNLRGERPAK